MVRYLTVEDLSKMVEVERETWIPPLQASQSTMERRLRDGHRYLGYFVNDELAGMVGWSRQKINSSSEFPKDFSIFSSGVSDQNGNASFIYNVGVARKFQKRGIGTKMVNETLRTIKDEEIHEVYLDGRCPSYNGSKEYPDYENVDQSPEFKQAIDRCAREGEVPTDKDVQFDPTLRFYYKVGFKPVILSANFLSADKTSGGYRVIMYMKL